MALADTGSERVSNCMDEEWRRETRPPARMAASGPKSPKSPKAILVTGASRGYEPSTLNPTADSLNTHKEEAFCWRTPTSRRRESGWFPSLPAARVVIPPDKLKPCGAAKLPWPSPARIYRSEERRVGKE